MFKIWIYYNKKSGLCDSLHKHTDNNFQIYRQWFGKPKSAKYEHKNDTYITS